MSVLLTFIISCDYQILPPPLFSLYIPKISTDSFWFLIYANCMLLYQRFWIHGSVSSRLASTQGYSIYWYLSHSCWDCVGKWWLIAMGKMGINTNYYGYVVKWLGLSFPDHFDTGSNLIMINFLMLSFWKRWSYRAAPENYTTGW